MAEIRNRWTNEVIVKDENLTVKELAEKHRANLDGANLDGANLNRANLDGANLDGANLDGANLNWATLDGATLEFHQLPSIRLLSSIPLGNLSDTLCLELMRRDAYGHPKPELFDQWANGESGCPYQHEERFWRFVENSKVWKPGDPEMRDYDLIIAICKAKGWKIKGYLK